MTTSLEHWNHVMINYGKRCRHSSNWWDSVVKQLAALNIINTFILKQNCYCPTGHRASLNQPHIRQEEMFKSIQEKKIAQRPSPSQAKYLSLAVLRLLHSEGGTDSRRCRTCVTDRIHGLGRRVSCPLRRWRHRYYWTATRQVISAWSSTYFGAKTGSPIYSHRLLLKYLIIQ